MTRRSLAACTSCGACAEACPETILEIAANGVALKPEVGECTFCGACADACPENVFADNWTMAHVMRISDDCLAKAGIACMTCRDVCPESAISMRPRIGVPFLPELDTGRCTGCAACSAACPAEAIHPVEKEPENV
ncbi:ferredoxin-type protein NapF [Meridianimarinicoccus roseus]|uniref:Ferredoxin-type protein NapF n=1 Tax=Meridianimarinicoccus roseus TaxID=2072018 RepID=A0A2V2LJF9_9RHOB|nr:ferredoxin-type protein NapF [Meridianimarinicoccus roseus]